MEVRLIVDREGPNPKFNPPDPTVDWNAYKRYLDTVPHTITIPKGTVIEAVDADELMHHTFGNGPPRAEPVDDEARLARAVYLAERDKKVDELRELARTADPDDAYGAHIIRMAKAYGVWEGIEEEEGAEAEAIA